MPRASPDVYSSSLPVRSNSVCKVSLSLEESIWVKLYLTCGMCVCVCVCVCMGACTYMCGVCVCGGGGGGGG